LNEKTDEKGRRMKKSALKKEIGSGRRILCL